jgi:oligopeptide/dipeptide ABC transporter ATP-binding protein
MYAGQIMEVAPVEALFARPQHPYTELLLRSLLRVDRVSDLNTAQAVPQVNITYGSGCRFANRCPYVRPECRERRPPPVEVAPGHAVICHKHVEAAS